MLPVSRNISVKGWATFKREPDDNFICFSPIYVAQPLTS
ncbi:hypothetical protein BH09BAC2_BH09BAC2_14920 [soil metagenome]